MSDSQENLATVGEAIPPETVEKLESIKPPTQGDLATPPAEAQTEIANIAELATPGMPTTKPQSTVADILPPEKGKGNRTLADYAKLNWRKKNSELAKEAGVSRQRIAQIRAELEGKKPAPTQEAVATESNISEESVIAEVETPTAEPAIAKTAEDYKLLAETTFQMGTGLLCMTLGPEWKPRVLQVGEATIDEKEVVCDALQKYYAAKQVKDLPPGVMLTFVLCSYAAPRFAVPNTKTKLAIGYNWCKLKVGNLFQRFKKKSVNVAKQITKENENQTN